MLKVLITGVDGFTGRYLAAELEQSGYEVIGIVTNSQQAEIAGVKTTYCCNLCDASNLAKIVESIKPNIVVHLAAISFVAHGDIEEIYRTNVIGTRNLLEAIEKSNCQLKSILIASSANVYGNTTADPITESTCVAPANDYAVSKIAMEYVAKLWFNKLPINLVRPFNYTGIGQSLNFLLPKIVDHFKQKSLVLELGNLDVIRDFSDVRSVVRSYQSILESSFTGETFNICSGQGHSLLDVLQTMRELSGHNPEIRVNPAFVRANEVHRLVGSCTKLDQAIGTTQKIPLKETLKWMLESAV